MPASISSSRRQAAFARSAGIGEAICQAGNDGLAWRLRSGVVRLDMPGPRGASFASLAIAGDIIGCETLLFGAYTFSATALTQCELAPWPEGESAKAGESLLASLATAQRRAADIVALRGGQATDRVIGLIRLLADGAGRVVLPSRQDIADITDLRFETISRIIKTLERSQLLAPVKIEGVHATRGFQLNPASLAY
ncbi:Crp/Fnr family transcriptional regulator [Dechloromonas denitrificans]|uniref:Crp/Fnr family transcriptional regulator n=1 Tax=Dechloromonas denitrificans TaxID=281362 RepID=UPI001CF8F3F4|nr:Crp/Fnr family transcriptional regulator [Dechloromonas denitrificans]UCV03599.1 Crp/Fnr family transcriptional regulator [Dechloromonas denitrificans]UCV07859.1 Crp/Fnr family transcriptional regulator [Dechloromonas denitrificans]